MRWISRESSTTTENIVYGEGVYKDSTHHKNPATMDATIEASAQAHQEVFTDSNCDKECIKKQLHKFYDKLCKGKEMTPRDKDGKVIERSGNNSGQGGI